MRTDFSCCRYSGSPSFLLFAARNFRLVCPILGIASHGFFGRQKAGAVTLEVVKGCPVVLDFVGWTAHGNSRAPFQGTTSGGDE